MLHNDKDLFERVVLVTSEKYGIVPVIIENDPQKRAGDTFLAAGVRTRDARAALKSPHLRYEKRDNITVVI